ncbi:MAG: type II toxin-antitoxin system VapB family antitoxin [Verrucomicrobiae bacterium]|nr:type II toxin-antitoxin system VapB family antitoxin [Verrucomicrobiae bacterium]
MATNLKIDESLLTEALRLGRFKTKKEAVNQALKEFVEHRKQLQILDWEGKVEFHEDYDHKALRKAR